MVGAGVIVAAGLVGASLVSQAGSLELFTVLVIGGLVAWRSKRGDFYKAVADEKAEQVRNQQDELDSLRKLTDITPIIDAVENMTKALARQAELTDAVFAKVADMNGSLRAHGEAMKALADHLILDEAARALLVEAATEKPREPRQKRRTS